MMSLFQASAGLSRRLHRAGKLCLQLPQKPPRLPQKLLGKTTILSKPHSSPTSWQRCQRALDRASTHARSTHLLGQTCMCGWPLLASHRILLSVELSAPGPSGCATQKPLSLDTLLAAAPARAPTPTGTLPGGKKQS